MLARNMCFNLFKIPIVLEHFFAICWTLLFHSSLSLIVNPKKLKSVTLSMLVFSICNDNGSVVLFTCLNIINLDFFAFNDSLYTFSQPLILFAPH